MIIDTDFQAMYEFRDLEGTVREDTIKNRMNSLNQMFFEMAGKNLNKPKQLRIEAIQQLQISRILFDFKDNQIGIIGKANIEIEELSKNFDDNISDKNKCFLSQ